MATNDGKITQSLPDLLTENKAEIEGFAKVSLLGNIENSQLTYRVYMTKF